MKIVSGNAPFVRSPRKTGHIMMELLIGLAVIFVAAVVYNFTLGVNYGLKAIGIMTVSILFTLISDLIAGSLRFNKEKDGQFGDYIVTFIKTNFSVVTAVIFALTVPIGTPVYVVALGSIFATLIVKHAFGGFGSNIFNPAALGRLFLALAFGNQLKPYLAGGESLGGLNAGVTVTGQFANSGIKFMTGTIASNVPMLDLWLGNYSGAIGETFTLLILVVGVVLAAREVINWRTPVFLFGTVALSSVFIALVAKVNIFDYLLLQFGLGGLVFGAIFMFTDPVTSPTSNFGKALIGVLGGLFNVLIRIAGAYPEGTAFSIALVNVFSPMIDKFYTGRTNQKIFIPYLATGLLAVMSVGLLTGVSAGKLPRVPDVSSSEPVGPYDHQKTLLGVSDIDNKNELTVDTDIQSKGVLLITEYTFEGNRVGIIYTAEITGYNPGLKFEVGLKDTVFAGFSVVNSDETAAIGGRFLDKVDGLIKGKPASDALFVASDYTGATYTAEPLKAALESIGQHYLVASKYATPKTLLGVTDIDGDNALTVDPSLETHGVSAIIEYTLAGTRVGVIYTAEITGYNPGLKFEVALKDNVFAGFKVVASSDTPTIGGRFLDKVDGLIKGKPAGDPVFVASDYTGATYTAEPLKAALEAIGANYLTLGGTVPSPRYSPLFHFDYHHEMLGGYKI